MNVHRQLVLTDVHRFQELFRENLAGMNKIFCSDHDSPP